jgi:hypothetical protein
MTDSAEHSSLAQGALAFMRSRAPADIATTISWLTGDGWTPMTGRGGEHEAFGNMTVEFGKDGGAIKIVRDRGIWELALRSAGWQRYFDLGLVVDTKAGRTSWTPSDGTNPYEVKQQPEGVLWAQALPEVLGWLANTPDAEDLLDEHRERRYGMLFPGSKQTD